MKISPKFLEATSMILWSLIFTAVIFYVKDHVESNKVQSSDCICPD